MWILAAYSKEGDAHVRDQVLSGIDAEDVKRLWGLPSDDPAYDAYPVSKDLVAELMELTGLKLDLSRFDYFVEYRVESGEVRRS